MSRPDYTVRLLRIAEDDFTDIVSYVGAEHPSAAEALADRIEANLAHLSRHPFLGRVPREEELARMGYRYLIVDDYLIFYTVEQRSIYVHRIIHGARNYSSLF